MKQRASPQRLFSISPSSHSSIITSTPANRSSNSRYHITSGTNLYSLRTHTSSFARRRIPNLRVPGLSYSIPHIPPVNHCGSLSAMAKSNINNQSNNNQRSLAMSVAAPKANVMASCYAVEAATGGLAAFHYCSSSRAGGMCTQASRTTRSESNNLSRSRVVGLREALET